MDLSCEDKDAAHNRYTHNRCPQQSHPPGVAVRPFDLYSLIRRFNIPRRHVVCVCARARKREREHRCGAPTHPACSSYTDTSKENSRAITHRHPHTHAPPHRHPHTHAPPAASLLVCPNRCRLSTKRSCSSADHGRLFAILLPHPRPSHAHVSVYVRARLDPYMSKLHECLRARARERERERERGCERARVRVRE